jgi:hypothetical protein
MGVELSLGLRGEAEARPYGVMRPSKGSQPLVLVGTRAPTHDDGEDTLVIKDLVGGEDLGNQCAFSGRVLETGKRGREGNEEVRG